MGRHPQDWYTATDRAELERVARLPGIPAGAVVEVGSFTGQSTEVLVRVFGKQRPILCVDPWGDMTYADRPDLPRGYAYPMFRENTQGTNVARFRCGWRDFFRVFDGPLAFIHIDAVHEYPDVHDNICAACSIAEPGTVFCGHDYVPHFPGVAQAVRECFPDHHVGGGDQKVWSWQWPLVS